MPNTNIFKEASFQIAAGGSAGSLAYFGFVGSHSKIIFAGFVEVCIMHPLDLIKTRFQVQRGPDDPLRYKGLADCFVKIYRNEGLEFLLKKISSSVFALFLRFLSFYKGILPPILAETPKRATKVNKMQNCVKCTKINQSVQLFSFALLSSTRMLLRLMLCPYQW